MMVEDKEGDTRGGVGMDPTQSSVDLVCVGAIADLINMVQDLSSSLNSAVNTIEV